MSQREGEEVLAGLLEEEELSPHARDLAIRLADQIRPEVLAAAWRMAVEKGKDHVRVRAALSLCP